MKIEPKIIEHTKSVLKQFGNRYISDTGTVKKNKVINDLNNYEEVIVYCGSGITASPVSLALTEVGIDHKLYAGSFSDWISYKENKVDTI